MGEVIQMETFEKDGIEVLVAFYQLVDSQAVVLDGRVRVWNAKV